MKLGRLFICFLFVAMFFAVSEIALMFGVSAIAEAQNKPLIKTQQPLVKMPDNVQSFNKGPGRPCNMVSVNDPAQAMNGEVFIAGTNLSEQCIVSFNTPYVTNYRVQKIALISPTSLKVWVPVMPNGGTGTINMKDPQNQFPEIQLPFLIVEGQGPACEMRNVMPTSAAVNGDVVIDGKNLGTLCTVAFKDGAGKMLNAPITSAGPMQMKVKVPANATPGSAGVYTNVKGRQTLGYGPWVFKIISGNSCNMTSLTPNAARPGDNITVKGNNFNHSCTIIVDDYTKKRFSIKPPTPVDAASATVKLPTGISSGQASVAMIDDSTPPSGTISGPKGFPLQIDPAKCELSSVTPNMAPIKAYVILKGSGLDQNCMVYIKSSPNGKAEQAYTTTDKDGFKTQVPYELFPGKGTIEARPYGQKTAGRELPFEVLPVAAVLQSLSPTGAIPGTNHVTVLGTNLDYLASSKAIIELQNGEKFDVPTGNNSATKFDLMVIPDIYKGYNITAKNAEHRQRVQQMKLLSVQKGNVISNKLGINIRSPYPILDQVNPSTVHPGDTIIVNGGNWIQAQITSYDAIFHLPGRTYQTKILPSPVQPPMVPIPYFPNITLVGMFSVKVPDVFAGISQAEQDAINNGTVQMSINGLGSFSSNKIDIQIRKKVTSTPPNTANSCPGGKSLSGYTYIGQPSCASNDRAGHPSAYMSCDSTGYYCCESAQGAKTKCGTDRWIFPADCMAYCASAAGNCMVEPVSQGGVFYGCYRRNP